MSRKTERRRAVSPGDWFTIVEAAEYIGMSVRYVEKRKADGTIPHYKNGSFSVRFRKDDLDAYIAASRRVGVGGQ